MMTSALWATLKKSAVMDWPVRARSSTLMLPSPPSSSSSLPSPPSSSSSLPRVPEAAASVTFAAATTPLTRMVRAFTCTAISLAIRLFRMISSLFPLSLMSLASITSLFITPSRPVMTMFSKPAVSVFTMI